MTTAAAPPACGSGSNARRGALAIGVVAFVVWCARLRRVKRGVEVARRFWAQPQGAPGGLLYVALGDSAAQGVGASRPDRGYVGLLAERLGCTTGQPVQVINLSSSGATIEDLLREQLPRLQRLQPDLVTVAIGGNDMFRADPVAFDACVDRLIAALPPQTVIADVPYFMHGHWERDARRSAGTVTRVARARGLPVVALHEALRREGWAAMASEFAADWFHPNDRGYRVWADAFWTTMRASALMSRLTSGQHGTDHTRADVLTHVHGDANTDAHR